MEFKGTIKHTREFEENLIKCYPHKLIHDSSQPYIALGNEGEPQFMQQSQSYVRTYQLFPEPGIGFGMLFKKRVNARFYYDERYGLGTFKISAIGISLLASNIKDMIKQQMDDVWIIPKHNITLEQARMYGATNLNGNK